VKRGSFVAVHILFAVLLVCIALPGVREQASPRMFVAVVILVELVCLWRLRTVRNPGTVADVGSCFFLLLLIWEMVATLTGWAHPILVPTPEAVFEVFAVHWELMLRGVFSSLSLLAVGFGIALPLGILFGALAGRRERFRNMAVPVARVMAPIPAIVFTPYFIALMPDFRSAAALIIVLGIFWPTFLQTVNRVLSIDPTLLDSARSLALNDREMIFQVYVPWLLPGVLAGMRVTLSTSFMLLTLAEMMGASSGLGYFIKNFADYANYTNVLAGIILVGLVITLLNVVLNFIQNRMVHTH